MVGQRSVWRSPDKRFQHSLFDIKPGPSPSDIVARFVRHFTSRLVKIHRVYAAFGRQKLKEIVQAPAEVIEALDTDIHISARVDIDGQEEESTGLEYSCRLGNGILKTWNMLQNADGIDCIQFFVFDRQQAVRDETK